MDFYQSQDNYILRKGEHSLWCNRVNGNLKIRAGKQHDACKLMTVYFRKYVSFCL